MGIDEEGQLVRIDYGDRIYFDSVLGIAGTTYPIGTADMPSDVIANAIAICVARHINKIHVTGTLAVGGGIAQGLVGHDIVLTVQTAGIAYVRDLIGHLEIDEMTGGTLNVYAHGADIQINADCTGGTINIYGNARVTGAGGGVVINNYTIQWDSGGKPNVQEVIIYPIAEDAGTTEIDDDGTAPVYYPAAPHSTNANAEGTPGIAWAEEIDFEQEGTINIISIYAEFEWQTLFAVGGGAGTNSISKIQVSRDGGANWVDLTDNFINPNAAMTTRIRAGVGLWIPTVVAGANQLMFRLVHWTDDGGGVSTSEAHIRSNSYVRITYRKE